MMPIVPYLTDGEENIDALHHAAKDAKLDYLLPGMLNLKGKTRETFFACVARDFPAQYKNIWEAYKNGRLYKGRRELVYSRVRAAQEKYGIHADYMAPALRRMEKEGEQLSFL